MSRVTTPSCVLRRRSWRRKGRSLTCPRHLNADDVQPRNPIKIPEVVGSNRIAKFQRTSSNDEIAQRQRNAPGGLFAADASDNLRCNIRYRIAWNCGFEFVQKKAPSLPNRSRVCPIDSMPELGYGQRRQNNWYFADSSLNAFDCVSGSESPALGRD